MPPKVISGCQMIRYSPELTMYTVVEPAFSVAVRIYHLLRAKLLCHIGKAASLLQNIGGRIMQEHDIFPIPVRPGQLKGRSEPYELPLDQLLGMGFLRLIPVHDPAAPVNPEGPFKGIAFGPYQSIVMINFKAVLML